LQGVAFDVVHFCSDDFCVVHHWKKLFASGLELFDCGREFFVCETFNQISEIKSPMESNPLDIIIQNHSRGDDSFREHQVINSIFFQTVEIDSGVFQQFDRILTVLILSTSSGT
jgi:hypothetical protein